MTDLQFWQTYSGSKRTFTALLRTMINKKNIAIVLALTRRNSSPIFCAMLPQVSTWIELSPTYLRMASSGSGHKLLGGTLSPHVTTNLFV